jgi:hypothetical protein
MPIVIGQERKVEGGPAELSRQARERAQKAIDAELNKLQEPNLTPDCEKPPRPEGCSDPKWSTTQRKWVGHPDTDRRWQIWDKNEWHDFKDWDKCQPSPPNCRGGILIHQKAFAQSTPFGHPKPAERPKTFWGTFKSMFAR